MILIGQKLLFARQQHSNIKNDSEFQGHLGLICFSNRTETTFNTRSAIKRMVVEVLMVAEKPSLAKSLAHILSNGSLQSSAGQIASHEYEGKFRGQHAHFTFTSVCGHVLSLDFLAKYNNW